MRSPRLIFIALLLTSTLGCGGRNVDGFSDTDPPVPPGTAVAAQLRVTRSETADQGSGAGESAGLTVKRTTVGGSYLRRVDSTSTGYRVSAGMHGKPTPNP